MEPGGNIWLKREMVGWFPEQPSNFSNVLHLESSISHQTEEQVIKHPPLLGNREINTLSGRERTLWWMKNVSSFEAELRDSRHPEGGSPADPPTASRWLAFRGWVFRTFRRWLRQ